MSDEIIPPNGDDGGSGSEFFSTFNQYNNVTTVLDPDIEQMKQIWSRSYLFAIGIISAFNIMR